jgi:hypothetical protein
MVARRVERARRGLALVTAALVLAGCATATVSSVGHSAVAAQAVTAAVRTTPTAAAGSTGTTTGGAGSTSTTQDRLPAVPGYVYTALPASLDGLQTALAATGYTSWVEASGVRPSGSTALAAAVVLAQYSPDVTRLVDATPVDQVLDGAAKGARANAGADGASLTISKRTVAGLPVRLLTGSGFAGLIAYLHGGLLVEVFGPTSSGVVAYSTALLPRVH